MDQAAAQPARASSAAPAHPIIAPAPAHAASTAPAHAGTVAHTAQPEKSWGEKSLEPGVFWNAASAVATALAVGAAFVVPWIADRRQRKRRRRYAEVMLRPVYMEARGITRLANHCLQLTDEAAALIGVRDARDPPAPGEVAYDEIAGRNVPSQMTLQRILSLASTTFPAYMANRSWLVDLDPQEAGAVQNAFTEAERCLAQLAKFTGTWVLSRDVGQAELAIVKMYTGEIHVSMQAATRVLRDAIRKAPLKPLPE